MIHQLDNLSILLDHFTLPFYVVDPHFQVVYANQSSLTIFNKKIKDLPFNLEELFEFNEFIRFKQAAELVRSQQTWEGELTYTLLGERKGSFDSKWVYLPSTQDILILGFESAEKRHLQEQVLRLQRMESIGSISSGLAHDFNNILATFLMAAKLLRQRVEDAQSQEVIGMIEKGVKRGISLVSHMLTFIRGEDPQNDHVQIPPIIQEVRDMMLKTWPELVHFELEFPEDLWKLKGNSVQIHQLILNLCVNARDILEEEGGILRITAENMSLDEFDVEKLLPLTPGRYICLRVIDTGKGIPPEIIDKIFEPFFTTKPTGKGSGLGLSTVIFIVKAHGGHLVLNSILNQGTEFVIYFPALEDETSNPLI